MKDRRLVVVLDPGHGGKDPGTVVNSIREADLTLSIARKVRDILEDQWGVEVLLTRSWDEFVPLAKRTPRAMEVSQSHDVIFVSIHVNASGHGRARGYEVWIRYPESSSRLAQEISRCLRASTDGALPARGIKTGRLFVLRQREVPSALVEIGFLDNPKDRAYITSPGGKQAIAWGIANGVITYIGGSDLDVLPTDENVD